MIPVKISQRARTTYRKEDGINVVWAWACERFGTPGQQPNGVRWKWDTRRTFFFNDNADAVLFALKWSQ